jgi:hypothetical protein
MEKSTIPSGLIAAHGHSSTLGHGPTRWPNPMTVGQPMPVEQGPCAASARTARGHHSGAQPTRGARWGGQRHGGCQTATRSSPRPSPWLQLLAATPKPKRGGRKEGPHQREGWGDGNQQRRWQKWHQSRGRCS